MGNVRARNPRRGAAPGDALGRRTRGARAAAVPVPVPTRQGGGARVRPAEVEPAPSPLTPAPPPRVPPRPLPRRGCVKWGPCLPFAALVATSGPPGCRSESSPRSAIVGGKLIYLVGNKSISGLIGPQESSLKHHAPPPHLLCLFCALKRR